MTRSDEEHIAEMKRWLLSGESLNVTAYQREWGLTNVQMARYINTASAEIKSEEKLR